MESSLLAAGTVYESMSDLEIVRALLAATSGENGGITAPDAVATAVLASVDEFTTEDETLQAAVVRLAEVAGAEWHVDPAKQLRWFGPTAQTAPFALDTRAAVPNLLAYSQGLDQSDWTKTRVDVTRNVMPRPDVVGLDQTEAHQRGGFDGRAPHPPVARRWRRGATRSAPTCSGTPTTPTTGRPAGCGWARRWRAST